MARYSRLPSFTSSIGSVSGLGGGLAVVMRPPASRRIQIPAATSHSQQPPSHHISKAPVATYARSSVALVALLVLLSMAQIDECQI